MFRFVSKKLRPIFCFDFVKRIFGFPFRFEKFFDRRFVSGKNLELVCFVLIEIVSFRFRFDQCFVLIEI